MKGKGFGLGTSSLGYEVVQAFGAQGLVHRCILVWSHGLLVVE